MTYPSLSTVVTIAVIYGALIALSRRPYTSLALTLYVLGFALLSSFMKQAYLGSAMTLADMHFFFLRPRENFYILVNYPVLGLTALGVLACAALVGVAGAKWERPINFANQPITRRWWRPVTAFAAIAPVIGGLLISDDNTHARVNDGDAFAAFLSMYEQQHPRGPINRLNIFFNNRTFEASLPIKREQKRFPLPDDARTGEAPQANPVEKTRPDILLVLEESTFDPTIIESCPKAACDNGMIHPLDAATRTQQGPLLVHTTGGGTWLAEFAALSAFDWRVFGRGGAYAPVSLAPRLTRSLPIRLHELGYRTIAIYPTLGNFLSATTAYANYGFDEFYDAETLQFPDEWGDVRDAMVFEKAEEIAQRENDPRPVFIFALTIRNHGPHGGKPELIKPYFEKIIPQTSVYMADYLGRMRDSSVDYVRFATHWLKSPRPSIIAWFGDHQPEAAWDFTEHPNLIRKEHTANVADSQLQFLTYYQFSANYGDRERTVSRNAVDLAFLNVELQTFAGLPLDAGANAARYVRGQCNGLLIECADRDLVNDYLSFRIHGLGEVK